MTSRILITGASGGFGKMTVETLLRRGHQVAASMREAGGRNAQAANELRDQGAHVVDIDVTEQGSVERGVVQALEQLGGLDVLINNAGIGVLGLQESFTPEDFQRLFDINVFGVQRMNRAVAPTFRKQQRGLLLHISSLLGRMTIPFYGPYNASKWALEALAENYRTELSAFGVETCLVEPGGYPTSFIDRLMKPSDRSREGDYGDLAQAPQAALENFEALLKNTPAQDPQNVADAVARLVETPMGQRPFRTVVDSLGMGAAIEPYNANLQQITEAVYGNFGVKDMLTVKLS